MQTSLIEKGNISLEALFNVVPVYTGAAWTIAYARIDYAVGENKVPIKVIKNCIASELVEIAKSNSWHISYRYGNTYIYNEEYWVKLEKTQLIEFVKNVSIRMGVPKYEAADIKFTKDLYEQLLHSGLFFTNTNPTDELLLNMQNGTLKIADSSIELREFRHKDFLTHQLQFTYDPMSTNQEWLDFLEGILPDEDSRRTLQEALGSLLLKGLKLEKVIMLYGTGANGKSVIFEVLNGLLGEEAMSNYSLNSLTDSKGYHRANLKDKLINYASDIDLSKVDAGTFKTLVSGEPIECRLPYQEPFIMKSYAKMIFNLNSIESAKIEYTHGFFRRMLFIPFEVTIQKDKQDKKLAKRLLENKAGILNWLLDGARVVMKNEEIFESQESKEFLLRFKSEPTTFEKFLLARQVMNDSTNTITSSEIYKQYVKMCLEENKQPLSQILFSKKMDKKGFNKQRVSKGIQWQVSCTP